jgi:hypothetical protein
MIKITDRDGLVDGIDDPDNVGLNLIFRKYLVTNSQLLSAQIKRNQSFKISYL